MRLGIIIVTVIYIAVNLVLGLWKLRKSTYEQFVAAPSTINKYAITMSLCGTVIGGGMFFTVAQMGFEAGFAVLALPGAYFLGYLLMSFATPIIRQTMASSGANTLYDLIGFRLVQGGIWTPIYKAFLSVVTLGMYFFMLAAQFTIIANFFVYSLGVSSTNAWLLSIFVIGGTTLIYSVAGGIRKDIFMDVFHVVIVFAGLIVLLAAMLFGHSLSLSNAPSSHFSFIGYGALFPIGILLFFSPSFLGRYDYWQRIIAAKSTKEARFALWFSLPMITIAYIICCFIGIYAKSQASNINSGNAAVWFIQNALSPGMSLVVTLALYAALMATSDTLLNVSSVSATSLVATIMPRYASVIKSIGSIRAVTILIGLSASVLVLLAADTVDLVIGGFSSLVILTPGILFVLKGRRPFAIAPCISLISGYLTFLVAFIIDAESRKYAFIIGFLVACLSLTVTILIVHLISSKSREMKLANR